MNADDFPRYHEGDVLRIRGHEYEVEQVDVVPNRDMADRVIQYRLEAVDEDAPPARLDPSPGDGVFAFVEYHKATPDDVEVVSGSEK
jgi:hypothetical protein